MIAFGCVPFASVCPCARWVDMIVSSSSSAAITPEATASWPIATWRKPGSSPARNRSSTFSSKRRISSISRNSSRRLSSDRASSALGFLSTLAMSGSFKLTPHEARRTVAPDRVGASGRLERGEARARGPTRRAARSRAPPCSARRTRAGRSDALRLHREPERRRNGPGGGPPPPRTARRRTHRRHADPPLGDRAAASSSRGRPQPRSRVGDGARRPCRATGATSSASSRWFRATTSSAPR